MSLQSPASGQDPGTDAGAPGRGRRRRVGIVVLVTVVLVAAGAAAYGLVDAKSSGPKASAPTTSDGTRRSRPGTGTVGPGHPRPRGRPRSLPPRGCRRRPRRPPPPPRPRPSRRPTARITSPPLPPPGPGFNEGQVTAVGDSVMIDYENAPPAGHPRHQRAGGGGRAVVGR